MATAGMADADGGGELPPLRICFVNTLYSDRLRRGGLGSHIADVSAALAARGHEVTIVTAGLGGR
jgi:glycogen synthase